MQIIDPRVPDDMRQIQQLLQASPKVVALTGAGISTSRGIAVSVRRIAEYDE